jgi:hypothetical protein
MKAIAALLCLLATCSAQEKHKIGVAQFAPPKYPTIGILLRKQGDVEARLSIAADGSVKAVVLDGPEMFYDAVKRSIATWRFTCLDCSPNSEFSHQVTFRFALNEKYCGDVLGSLGTRYDYDFPHSVTITTGALHHKGLAPDVIRSCIDDGSGGD